MNLEKGLTRIYIVGSVLWAIFSFFIGYICSFDYDSNVNLCIIGGLAGGILPPIIVYLIIKWIINGFKG